MLYRYNDRTNASCHSYTVVKYIICWAIFTLYNNSSQYLMFLNPPECQTIYIKVPSIFAFIMSHIFKIIMLQLFIFWNCYNRYCVSATIQFAKCFNITSDTQTYLKFSNICLGHFIKYNEVYCDIKKFILVNGYYMQYLGLGPGHNDSLWINMIKINIFKFGQNLLLKHMFIENPIFLKYNCLRPCFYINILFLNPAGNLLTHNKYKYMARNIIICRFFNFSSSSYKYYKANSKNAYTKITYISDIIVYIYYLSYRIRFMPQFIYYAIHIVVVHKICVHIHIALFLRWTTFFVCPQLLRFSHTNGLRNFLTWCPYSHSEDFTFLYSRCAYGTRGLFFMTFLHFKVSKKYLCVLLDIGNLYTANLIIHYMADRRNIPQFKRGLLYKFNINNSTQLRGRFLYKFYINKGIF